MSFRLERLALWLAAAVCLLFAGGLRDVGGRVVLAQAPAFVGSERDAALSLSLVRAEERTAVEGARVRLYAVDGEGRAFAAGEARSGGDGVALFEGLPRGETWIVVEGEGLARASARVVLEAGTRELTLPIYDAEQIEVVVVDASQRPIRNARVTVHGADPLPHPCWTDATGLCAFDALGPPPYAVVAEATGFGRKLVRDAGPDDSPLFVKLEREGQLDVRVLGPEGEPVAGASVTVAGSALWPAHRADTDVTGRVMVGGLPRGFYEVRAEKGDLVSDPGLGVLLDHGEQRELEVRLSPGAYVTVLVTDGDGEPIRPIAEADVALVEGGLSSFPLYGRTGEDGRARLGPIAGGEAVVSVQARGFVPRSALPVAQGEDELRVALARGAVLTGRVVDESGAPVEGARLEVIGVALDGMPIVDSGALLSFRRDHFDFGLAGPLPLLPRGELGVMPVIPDVPGSGTPLVASTSRGGADPWMSRADGTFRLEPVTPGRVQVVARHPAFVEAMSEVLQVEPASEGELEIVLRRGGTLEGRVLEQDGSPAAGARIELASVEGTVERITYAADDGTFAFAAVPEDVILSVSRAAMPEHVVERLQLEVPSDRRAEIEIVLPEERDPVLVRVTDDRGFPIERAEIRVVSLDPASAVVRTLFSDAGGEATMPAARGLPLRFTASRRGHAPLVLEVEQAPAEVSLALAEAVTAEGEVFSREGPVAKAQVLMLTPTGERRARTDDAGRFAIDQLAEGDARLMVSAEGYAFDERIVAIESRRGHADLGRIELVRAATIEGEVIDDRGDPVAGARVAVGRVPTYLPLGSLPPGMAVSDSQGRFVLRDVLPGTGPVEAYKAGHGRAATDDIDIDPGETVRGVRVVVPYDPDSAPSASAASLAVTLSERPARRGADILFAHVPYGGEAQRAGIQAGDQLLSVNGLPVRSLERARELLDGPLSQDMVLQLFRAPDLRWSVRLRRERIRR